MRRRWPRIVFFAAVAVFWLAAVGIALEVYTVASMRARLQAAERYGNARMAEAVERDAEIMRKYVDEPPVVGTDLEARASFFGLDEAARQAFVKEREELVLLCDREGVVRAKYAAPAPPEIAAMAERAAVGESLASLLPAVEAADAQRALQDVAATGQHQPREYEVPLPDGGTYVAQFYFYPSSDVQTPVGVFVRESMWEVPWRRFRPNVAQNDAYAFRTNSRGWRDDEVVSPKPDGVLRIVCVGGSTTAEGPSNALTYPNMLEAQLRRRHETEAIDVVNCGVWAVGSSVERERLPDYLALDPDLLLHYNFVNDVTDHVRDWIREGEAGNPLGAVQALLRRSRFLRQHFEWALLPGAAHFARCIREHTLANVRALARGAQDAGVDVALCSFAAPDVVQLERIERDYFEYRISTMLWGRTITIETYARLVAIYNAQVRELCAARDWIYLPVAERLDGGSETFSDICHVRLAGMERKARIIADALDDYVAARTGGQ